jgi:PhzF family phenazine biosynthesis protein
MNLPLYQADAFTDTLFKGNPAAVVPLESWLPRETMQAIAAENNLAETAFFVKNGDAFDLKWFTPTVEVDLCGHATLATAKILYEFLGYTDDEIRFATNSGRLTMQRNGDLLTLDFPADPPALVSPSFHDELTAALGVAPQEVYAGKTDLMVILENEAAVAALQPDFRALAQLKTRGVIVTAPGESVDFVSRFFGPQSGIDEDPVTGSAHTTLTPYWAHRLGKLQLTARQISPRGGDLWLELLGDRVLISGKAVVYLRGEMFV